jgi:hypothetical protein
MIVVPGAYEAAGRGDMKQSYKLILHKVKELDAFYDKIVLAQISMSEAVEGYTSDHAVIFTSPSSAYKVMMERINVHV